MITRSKILYKPYKNQSQAIQNKETETTTKCKTNNKMEEQIREEGTNLNEDHSEKDELELSAC